jgi:NADPH:quinone reductase-like Zn-dependent oxidoreductase
VKAIVYQKYGSPDVLELKEVPRPIPKDDEVLIKVHAAVATPTDCAFQKGEPFVVRFYTGLTRPKNTILGMALAGEIVDAGKGVASFKPGDRVLGASNAHFGAYAEYICLAQDGVLAKMSPDMSFGEAAGMSEGFLTAIPFLRDRAKIQRGQKVLINGASGSIGTIAVQLAKHFGAEVTGVCSTANLELVKSLGADHVIDYTKEDFTQIGQTYDIIFDTVGKISFSRCKKVLKKDGVYLITAFSPVILLQVLWTSMRAGKTAKNAATGLRKGSEQTRDLILLNEMFAAGTLRAVIDRSYTLEQTAEAHRYVDRGHKRGSVVITLDHLI